MKGCEVWDGDKFKRCTSTVERDSHHTRCGARCSSLNETLTNRPSAPSIRQPVNPTSTWRNPFPFVRVPPSCQGRIVLPMDASALRIPSINEHLIFQEARAKRETVLYRCC